VKPLLAILCSVALVWAQVVPVVCAHVAPAAAKCPGCTCCPCGKGGCCMDNTSPCSQPAPATPAPRVSESGQLLLLAPAVVLFVVPPTRLAALTYPLSSWNRAAATPLYQWKCALLI